MKAAVLHETNCIRFEEVKKPEIEKNEVLVKVKTTGICGSDHPRVLGEAAHYYPIILGHEFAGEIVETGSEVKKLKKGDRVAGAPLLPCHECPACLKGNHAQCDNYSFIGSREAGSWAEYVKLPAVNAVKLPENVSFLQGAFFEPTTVGLHALFMMNFQGGRDVAVLGTGTIGLLALQCARVLGARKIFAFDVDEERLEVAGDYGADYCINTGRKEFKDIVEKETEGRGFPVILECAGVEFTEKLSLELAANRGKVMFIGTPSRQITLKPEEFEHINRKELEVRGSWMSYSPPFPGEEWELAGYYFKNGMIQIEKLIDRIIPLQQIDQAFKDIDKGEVKGKIILQNNSE